MKVSMCIRRTATAVEPVRDQGPSIAAISGLGAAQISTEIDSTAIGIARIYQNQLVVKGLRVQQVHVENTVKAGSCTLSGTLVVIGICRDFRSYIERSPVQTAIR